MFLRPCLVVLIPVLASVTACSSGQPGPAAPASPSTTTVAVSPMPVPASSTAAAPPAVHPPSSKSLVVVDCSGQGQVRPASYVIACADANDQLTGLRWTRWGPNIASGTGQETVNDCTPTCVAGHEHTYPVDVTLSAPAPWSGHAGTLRFGMLTLRYSGGRPPRAPATVSRGLPG
jgi:hypothetical protein